MGKFSEWLAIKNEQDARPTLKNVLEELKMVLEKNAISCDVKLINSYEFIVQVKVNPAQILNDRKIYDLIQNHLNKYRIVASQDNQDRDEGYMYYKISSPGIVDNEAKPRARNNYGQVLDDKGQVADNQGRFYS